MVAAIAIALIALFSRLAAIGLIGPDEPRYAWIARAMAQTHDWVTPRLYGQPWFEKPILYYWAAGAGFEFLRSAEWAARLPSACAALAATLCVGWLAWKHYGERAAWLVVMIFPTTIAAIAFAHAATPDMLFASSLTVAMASAAGVLRAGGYLRAPGAIVTSRRDALYSVVLFGAWLGVATLAKGPAAVALAGGALALWALCARRWRAVSRLAHPLAIVSFLVVAVPWYALCAARNPDFLRTFLFLHNVERYLTPVFQHRQPFWFFGPIVLIALLPWTALLWLAGVEGLRLWREKSWHDSPGFFFACWAIFPVAFFSFSQSKLPGYILPVVPPLALIVAVALDRAIERRALSVRYMIASAAIAVSAIYLYGMHVLRGYSPGSVDTASQLTAIAVMLLFIMTALVCPSRYAVTLVSVCVATSLYGVSYLATKYDARFSARPMAAAALVYKRIPKAGYDEIAVFRVHRDWQYGLNFYFGRVLPKWSQDFTGSSLVYTSEEGLAELGREAVVTPEAEFGIPRCYLVRAQRPPP